MNEGRSIQSKLLLGFITSTLFVLFVVGFSIVFLNRAEDVRSVKDQINDLNSRLFELRDIENQFYEYDNLSGQFFESGADLITDQYENEFDQLRSGLNVLIHSDEIDEIQQTQLARMDSMLLHYSVLFTRLKNQVQIRGFKNYGLEGKMRRYAHELEDENTAISSVDLLMLRRHEKDFFLRGEAEYLNKFNSLCTKIRNELTQLQKEQDLERLNAYHEIFNQVVKAESTVGTDSKSGIRGDLKNLSSRLSLAFENFSKQAQKDISKRIATIENFYFASIGTSLLFSIILAFYLSNALAKPLREITLRIRKFDFEDVRNAQTLESDTTTEEIIMLSNSFNSLINVLAEQISLVDTKGAEIQEQNLKLQHIAEELKASDNIKERFFTIISRDLKGPISNMGVYIEAITSKSHNYDEEDVKLYSTKLLESVNQLNDLMENLVEWSRTQTESIQFNPEPIKLKKLIKSNMKLIQLRAEKKNISVSTDVEEGLKAFADKYMVDFVLRNLLSNAIKFTPQNAKVMVSAFINDDHVEISVKDNGIGIPPEAKSKIFNSTRHLATFGTAEEKGTGLGLMLCKNFVERNRGEIWLNSELGKGTRVTFSLPRNR